MKKISLSLVAIVAGIAANGCQRAPTEEMSSTPTERSGRVSLRIDVGSIGVLARSASMKPTKLVLRFLSTGVPAVLDTILAPKGGELLKDYSLSGGRQWALEVTDYDQRDSVLHAGTETFRIGFDSTTNIKMSLDARYSSFVMKFPVVDRGSRVSIGVDGANWCDTTWAGVLGGDTLKVQRDYLTASVSGVSHTFSLKVSGDRGDKDTVLYSLDTSIQILSGESRGHSLTLRWVGPSSVRKGNAALSVSLGSVGLVEFGIGYSGADGSACREWTDSSGFSWNPAISYGTLCDARDGQTYRTVVIGSQKWMAQNLNYAGSVAEGEWGMCVDQVSDFCRKYGRLYSIDELMRSGTSLCPRGWHIPTDDDWNRLIRIVGASGRLLKSQDGWFSEGSYSGGGPDSLGFRALPSGYVWAQTSHTSLSRSMVLGSSSGKGVLVYYRSDSMYDVLEVLGGPGGEKISARCVED